MKLSSRCSRKEWAKLFALLLLVVAVPCYGTVESSLAGLKTTLTQTILPVLAVCGMALASLSFFTGNPNAKQHIVYAIVGCIFGFGAQAIVDLISRTVR